MFRWGILWGGGKGGGGLIFRWGVYVQSCIPYVEILQQWVREYCVNRQNADQTVCQKRKSRFFLWGAPPPQFCSRFDERCAMCWIKWKINFMIFIFRIIVKNHRKLAWFEYKNDPNSKNTNRKNLKFDFSFDAAHFASFM